MAEQNAEFVEREIKLNEEFIGERRLRYIYFYHPNIVSTEWKESSDCTPLFLGADVLLGCNISHNNLPRVHAKHAKRGLATKVNFPAGHKVLGIHGTAHGVWFYSIQGIFKIVFDYYSREEQQQCLNKLQKIWLRQILDPVLTKEVHVVVREKTAQSFELQDGRTIDCKTTDTVELVDKIKKNIDGYLLKTGNECLKQELGLLQTYTCFAFMNVEKNMDSFVGGAVNLLKNCLGLLPLISEKSVGFSEKETILCEVARWLGTEFANYHAHVNESVTAFKQKHIRCVENLPSAEVLVSEVFPSSMQTLLQCWLRVGDDAEKQNATNAERSKDSTETVPLTLFPVVQLILELANQNLLSGVAHVLYSRLIQSESV